jgi:predicted metal-dependent peptidase
MDAIVNAMRDVWTRDAVLGAILARLDIQHVHGEHAAAATMKTNGRELIINDDWTAQLTRNQIGLVLAHEALHVARGHNVRRGTTNKELWNKAADAAINHELRGWPAYDFAISNGTTAEGLGLPAGKDARAYATLLLAVEQQKQSGNGEEGNNGTDGSRGGADSTTGQGAEGGEKNGERTDDGQISPEKVEEMEGDTTVERSTTSENSPTTGEDSEDGKREGSDGADDCRTVLGMPENDVEDHPEPNAARAAGEQEMMVMQAIEAAAQCGPLPSWAQELRAVLTAAPQLNWKVLLRQWLLRRARVRRTFERPSRRQAMMRHDLIQPGRGGRKVGKVAVLVDVSGSMYEHKDKLDQAVGEIASLIAVMPDTEVRVIQWDTSVKKVDDFHGSGPKPNVEWKWTGGGGTRIEAALKAAKEWRADVQVIWTDGEIWQLPDRMEVPTLWCVTKPSPMNKKLGETVLV